MPNLRTSLLLAGSLLGACLAPLGSSSIAVAIPLIAESLESDAATVTRLLVGSYLFISIVGQVPGGRLADRFGSLPVLYGGLTIYLLGCLLGYLVENIWSLTASRMAMALGTALIGPATAALIRVQIPVSHLAFAFGIFNTSTGAAATMGPWIGGLVVSHQHWSWVFAINLPVAAISALLIYSSTDREKKETKREAATGLPLDWQGMLLLAAAVLCLQAGLGYPSAILLAGAAVCFYLFYRNERQHLSPIVHGSLFDNSIFRKCCAMSALNYFTMYGVLFQVPILLIVLGQTDPLRAGTMLLAMTAAMMFSGFSSGFLIASLGTRATLIVAQTAGLAGSFSLMFLMPHYGEAAVMPSIALLGVSAGLVMPSVRATAVGCVSASLAGTASGSEGTARYIGGALGIACMSAVLATGDDLATHISVLYLYAAAVSLTLIIALTLPRHIELIGNDETD